MRAAAGLAEGDGRQLPLVAGAGNELGCGGVFSNTKGARCLDIDNHLAAVDGNDGEVEVEKFVGNDFAFLRLKASEEILGRMNSRY